MGFFGFIKDQFFDVIEFEDTTNKLIISKYHRSSGNNELKQGSRVIVRESQCAVFLKAGQLADVLFPGTYSLTTGNFPVLSKLQAFPFLFTSPVIAELYFISTRQFIDNKWATKNPVLKHDANFSMVRIRAFGKFAFRISDPTSFMKEIFSTKGIVMTYDVIEYFSSMVTEYFSTAVGESPLSVLELVSEYMTLSTTIQQKLNNQAAEIGIQFSNILIESISLPESVETMIDEQSKINIVKNNMDSFVQYQTAQAMRDAVKQKSGLAGLSAGIAFGNTIAKTVTSISDSSTDVKSKAEQLRELKSLLDDGILTQDEFDAEKKSVLGK